MCWGCTSVQQGAGGSARLPAAKVIAIGVVLFWNYGANFIWTYRIQ